VALKFSDAAVHLVRIGQRFDARGWVLGTSGNFSIVVDEEPVRLAITKSGTHKGELTTNDILEVGEEGTSIGSSIGTGVGTPSAETRLHLEIVAARPAAAVLHTHSIWSTLLSDRLAARGGVEIKGYEMLKGLAGVTTHEHREWIPILDNDQDMVRLAVKIGATLRDHPTCHGFLLRRHGLYTWGATVPEAVRHVEIIEFLLETIGRKEAASWRS
jgi:methylthioribulose-1-phosphate dehydratase